MNTVTGAEFSTLDTRECVFVCHAKRKSALPNVENLNQAILKLSPVEEHALKCEQLFEHKHLLLLRDKVLRPYFWSCATLL